MGAVLGVEDGLGDLPHHRLSSLLVELALGDRGDESVTGRFGPGSGDEDRLGAVDEEPGDGAHAGVGGVGSLVADEDVGEVREELLLGVRSDRPGRDVRVEHGHLFSLLPVHRPESLAL